MPWCVVTFLLPAAVDLLPVDGLTPNTAAIMLLPNQFHHTHQLIRPLVPFPP
jgi:hypothetical protein